MKRTYITTTLTSLVALFMLTGCESNTIGPDEFAVYSREKLEVPENYHLQPPTPGAKPKNFSEPATLAYETLLQTKPNEIEFTSLTSGEFFFMQKAKTPKRIPEDLRSAIDIENQELKEKNTYLITFFMEDFGKALNPHEEQERLKNLGLPVLFSQP